jgi:hypothetical protein
VRWHPQLAVVLLEELTHAQIGQCSGVTREDDVPGRWPTVLGVGVAALTLSEFDDGREFAIVLLIASVGYLAIAVLERPASHLVGSHRPTCGRCLFAPGQYRS